MYRHIWPVRLEWRFGAVSSILQSAFNNCQLGTLHSGLLFVWLSAITFNNRPLVTRQKVNNIIRDVCSGQPPLVM